MDKAEVPEYFLQTVKDGDTPAWPVPEDGLIIGNQPLGSGYIQYWAYPASSGKRAEDLPPAEVAAAEHKTSSPAILIDQKSDNLLNIVLVKDGHAWLHTDSSTRNLEDSIATMLDFARDKFSLEVEHFMTTEGVSREVEQRLDRLENSEAEENGPLIRPLGSNYERPPLPSRPQAGNQNSRVSGRLAVIVPAILIIGVFAGAVIYKDKILNRLKFNQPAKEAVVLPSPTPIPTPTAIPLDRGQYKVRVLNGTTKTGAAGSLADTLKDKGWEIVSTGNAKKQTGKVPGKARISVKESLDQVLATMTADLENELAATTGAELKSTDKADVEVVIEEILTF